MKDIETGFLAQHPLCIFLAGDENQSPSISADGQKTGGNDGGERCAWCSP